MDEPAKLSLTMELVQKLAKVTRYWTVLQRSDDRQAFVGAVDLINIGIGLQDQREGIQSLLSKLF